MRLLLSGARRRSRLWAVLWLDGPRAVSRPPYPHCPVLAARIARLFSDRP